MSKAALIFPKNLFKWTVEEFRLETKDVSTCLHKITGRFPFLPVLAKRDQGTRRRNFFGKLSLRQLAKLACQLEAFPPKNLVRKQNRTHVLSCASRVRLSFPLPFSTALRWPAA